MFKHLWTHLASANVITIFLCSLLLYDVPDSNPYSAATTLNYQNILTLDFSVQKIASEYDQEIPQSQTADNPMAPRGRSAQPSRDTRKTN